MSTRPVAGRRGRRSVLVVAILSTRRVVVAVLLVGGAAGLVVLRAGVLGVSAVTRFDLRVRAAADSHWELPLLGRVAVRALAELGQRGLTVTVVLVLVVLAVRRSGSWRPGLVSAGALGLLGVLGQVLKIEVGRLAPRAAWVAVHAGRVVLAVRACGEHGGVRGAGVVAAAAGPALPWQLGRGWSLGCCTAWREPAVGWR